MRSAIRSILVAFPLAAFLALPAQGDLISHHEFNEGIGTTGANQVIGAPAGTLIGDNVSWAAPVAPGSTASIAFPGSGANYVDLGANSLLNGVSGLTFAAWINPEAHPAGGTGFNQASLIWFSHGTETGARAVLQLNTNGSFRFGGRRLDSQGFASLSSPADVIVLGANQHVAATVDFTTGVVSLYHNGSLVNEGVVSNFNGGEGGTMSATDSARAIFGVGGNFTNEVYNGRLDDVRIYDHVLSSTEIAALVPEPSTYAALFGVAVLGLAVWRRRR